MIDIKSVTKRFGEIDAVKNVDLCIEDGEVFGIVGTNGAGKSTLLRMMAGILLQDEGEISLDGEMIFENPAAKERIFYVSDDQYFFPNATSDEMIRYYKKFYPKFDTEKMYKLLSDFGIDKNRKVSTFSKGMKKQLSLLLGLFSGTAYLLLDETFDGLDPVMRQAAKSLIAKNMVDLGQTPVIASHNLRELEDICDHVGLLHNGGIILSKDLIELRTGLHRLQCVFADEVDIRKIEGLDIIQREDRGKLHTLTVRGDEEKIREIVEANSPIFYEMLPLSLEEIFISETENAGYDIKTLIF